MLEDVTSEGAMRLEEAIRRNRARPELRVGRKFRRPVAECSVDECREARE